jgi:hypothetical protein
MFKVWSAASADSEGSRPLSAAPAPRPAVVFRRFRRERPADWFLYLVI